MKSAGTFGVRAHALHERFGSSAIAARTGRAMRSHPGRAFEAAHSAAITAAASVAYSISRTGITFRKNGFAASHAPG